MTPRDIDRILLGYQEQHRDRENGDDDYPDTETVEALKAMSAGRTTHAK